MAASFETTKTFSASRRDLEQVLLNVLRRLDMRWERDRSAGDSLTVVIPINDCTWGEKIEIRFVGPSTLYIRSRCILPLQLYDWGKNRLNVHRIASAIDGELRLRNGVQTGDAGLGPEPSNTGSPADEEQRADDGGHGHRKGGEGGDVPAGVGEMTLEEALIVLGLSMGATREDIQVAYREQAKKYHPDQVPPGLAEEFKSLAEEKMKVINAAYSLLTR